MPIYRPSPPPPAAAFDADHIRHLITTRPNTDPRGVRRVRTQQARKTQAKMPCKCSKCACDASRRERARRASPERCWRDAALHRDAYVACLRHGDTPLPVATPLCFARICRGARLCGAKRPAGIV